MLYSREMVTNFFFLFCRAALMWCTGQTVINAVSGICGTKRESDGLYLPATSTFRLIGVLSTRIKVTASAAMFVQDQVTVYNSGSFNFWTKLEVNNFNAGSLVQCHMGTSQVCKTARG